MKSIRKINFEANENEPERQGWIEIWLKEKRIFVGQRRLQKKIYILKYIGILPQFLIEFH